MPQALRVDLHKLARFTNAVLFVLPILFFALGTVVSFYFHFLTVAALFLLVVNLSYRYVQNEHTILRNFGLIGQGRYLIESIGPEFRQYLYSNDREERPFNRLERSNVYRKAKNVESAASRPSSSVACSTATRIKTPIRFDLKKYALKLCVMKTIPIMQAQHNLSKVLRSLAPGERVAITRNKKIVAELVAPLEQKSPQFPDFAARARATWGGTWQGSSSDALLDESRGNR